MYVRIQLDYVGEILPLASNQSNRGLSPLKFYGHIITYHQMGHLAVEFSIVYK